MTELLVVKAGDEYYRFGSEDYLPCSMSKASVFPLGKHKEVIALCQKMEIDGIKAQVMKLTINEEPYSGETI